MGLVRSGWRWKVAALAAGLAMGFLAGCGSGASLGAAADPYGRPGRLVTLDDGRVIDLRCRGHGAPTVLLESGWGATSEAWDKVQPVLARTTRVCAYDRAGYAFSSPGPLPRDGAAIVRDLDQMLAKAGERGPYIVVGHSAGGMYGRLFAARNAESVVGIVLLDPTVEQQLAQPSDDGLDGIRRRVRRCLATSEEKPPLPDGDAKWKGCVSSRPNAQDVAVAHRPENWRNQLSELDEIFGATSQEVMRIGAALRSIPIYAITASESATEMPSIGSEPVVPALVLSHQMIAAASRDGSQKTVMSSHLVMIDRPDVVIDAVSEMIRAAREKRLPTPLGPSETEAPSAEAFGAPEDSASKASPFSENLDPAK